ncbi:hypothetical protein [Nocardia sp. XZ_19_369]|uniref:hypothetical protein n=1 Tax=Nocardia sp. XZ_19_369 TaxID=2769487 RepID=UPI00188E85D0|nr:hypothetical protein [Nocardia sp. XZ_19_369]
MSDPAFDIQDANAILMSICELIISNPAYQEVTRDSLTLVTILDDEQSMFGYVYTDDGNWVARTPDGTDILRMMTELRSAMATPGEGDWKSCLIQIKRADMSLSVDLEYDDANRWRVTPDNFEEMVEELRPQ